MAEIAGTTTLLAYWRFGDGASPFADTSGHAAGPVDASTIGSGSALNPDYTPGALPTADDDGAVRLIGHYSTAGEILEAPDSSPTRLNRASSVSYMTVCAWVKPTMDSNTFTSNIIGTWNADVFGPCGWRLAMNYPARTVTFERTSGGTPKFTLSATTGAIRDAEWTFIAATYGTDGIKMYVNGALVATAPGSQDVPAFNNGVKFGTDNILPRYLPAALDEISIWGAALAADEIATLAEAGGLATSEAASATFVTGTYTAVTTDRVILASNGTYTITLYPAATKVFSQLTVKNTGSGTVTLDGAGSETIDGSGTLALAAGAAATIISAGTNWAIIGAYP
jgi:hypothetical protein